MDKTAYNFKLEQLLCNKNKFIECSSQTFNNTKKYINNIAKIY